MNIVVNTPKTVGVKKNIVNYINEKFQGLSAFNPNIQSFKVRLTSQRLDKMIEAVIQLPQRQVLVFRQTGSSFHEIIDLMKDKIKVKLSRIDRKNYKYERILLE